MAEGYNFRTAIVTGNPDELSSVLGRRVTTPPAPRTEAPRAVSEVPLDVTENPIAKAGEWFATSPGEVLQTVESSLGAVEYDLSQAAERVNDLSDLLPGYGDGFLRHAADVVEQLAARQALIGRLIAELERPYDAAAAFESSQAAVLAGQAAAAHYKAFSGMSERYNSDAREAKKRAEATRAYLIQVGNNLDTVLNVVRYGVKRKGKNAKPPKPLIEQYNSAFGYEQLYKHRIKTAEATNGYVDGVKVDPDQERRFYELAKTGYNEALSDICVFVFNPLLTTASTLGVRAKVEQFGEQVKGVPEESWPSYVKAELLLRELKPIIDRYVQHAESEQSRKSGVRPQDSQQVLSGTVIDEASGSEAASVVDTDALPDKVRYILGNIDTIVTERKLTMAAEQLEAATAYHDETIQRAHQVHVQSSDSVHGMAFEAALAANEGYGQRHVLEKELSSHRAQLRLASDSLGAGLAAAYAAALELKRSEGDTIAKLNGTDRINAISADLKQPGSGSALSAGREALKGADEILAEVAPSVFKTREGLLNVLRECALIGVPDILEVCNSMTLMEAYYNTQAVRKGRDDGQQHRRYIEASIERLRQQLSADTLSSQAEGYRPSVEARVKDFFGSRLEWWDRVMRTAATGIEQQ